jgi:Protein of unknown function (DUF3485)
MLKKLILPACLVLIIAFGVANGMWTDRWSMFEGPAQASAKLHDIPQSIGDWEGKDQELDASQVSQAGIVGYVMRHYTNRVTGETVQVLLVCGSAGPTSCHTPDICYAGQGYELATPPTFKTFPATSSQASATFNVGRFQKAGPTPDILNIYWAWNATGTWNAPANPRWAFGHHRFLYKLYVIRPQTKTTESSADDTVPAFLQGFLPQVQKFLLEDAGRPLTTACSSFAPRLSDGRLS